MKEVERCSNGIRASLYKALQGYAKTTVCHKQFISHVRGCDESPRTKRQNMASIIVKQANVTTTGTVVAILANLLTLLLNMMTFIILQLSSYSLSLPRMFIVSPD